MTQHVLDIPSSAKFLVATFARGLPLETVAVRYSQDCIWVGDYKIFPLKPNNLLITKWRIESNDGKCVAHCRTLKEATYRIVGYIVKDIVQARLNEYMEIACTITSAQKDQEQLS